MAKKTRTELSTLAINTNLPDNTSELITPTTERAQLTDERESVVNYKDDFGGATNAGKFLTVAVDGESLTMVDEPQGDIQGSGVDGQITYWDGTKTVTSDAMLLIDTTYKTLKIVIPAANGSGGISLNAVSASASSSLQFLYNGTTYAQLYYDNSTGHLRLVSDGDVEINAANVLRVLSAATFSSNITVPIVRGYEGQSLTLSTQPTGGALTPRLTILEGGSVGIGTTSPTVSQSGYGMEIGNNFQNAGIRFNAGTSGWAYTEYYHGSTAKFIMGYRQTDDSFRIRTGASLVSGNGLTISSGGLATFSNGIQFGGTPSPAYDVAATTLDAYEEGNWTPAIKDQSGHAATLNATSSVGVYTRIGNVVYWRVNAIMTTKPAAMVSGEDVRLYGFPYASSAIPDAYYRPSTIHPRRITFSGSLSINVVQSASYAILLSASSGSAGGTVTISGLVSNSTISATGFYTI